MTSYVDVLRVQIEDNLDRCDELLDWIDREAPPIIRTAVPIYLMTIPPLGVPVPANNPLTAAWLAYIAGATGRARQLVSVYRAAVSYVGSPDALRAARDVIGTSIVTPAHDLAARITPGNLDSTDPNLWNDGLASSGYARKVIDRDDETRRVAELAAPLGQGLGDMADAIEAFYIELALAVAGAVSFLVGVVVAVIGLAVAVATAGAGVGVPVAGVISACVGIFTVIGSAIAMWVTLQQTMDGVIRSLTLPPTTWPAVMR